MKALRYGPLGLWRAARPRLRSGTAAQRLRAARRARPRQAGSLVHIFHLINTVSFVCIYIYIVRQLPIEFMANIIR